MEKEKKRWRQKKLTAAALLLLIGWPRHGDSLARCGTDHIIRGLQSLVGYDAVDLSQDTLERQLDVARVQGGRLNKRQTIVG